MKTPTRMQSRPPKTYHLKLRFLIFFIVSIFIYSCKKSSGNDPVYYFSADFDGIAKLFNSTVTVTKSNPDSGSYSLTIVGLSQADEAGLTLWSNKDDFAAGNTYLVTASNDSNNVLFYISSLDSSKAFSSVWNTIYPYGNTTPSFSCTITDMTAIDIKGSFSGTIYLNSDSALVSKNITNGEFYAKIQ